MGLIRLLIYGALIWLLVRLVKGVLAKPQPRREPTGNGDGRLQGGELVQDPECGVYIPREGALKDRQGNFFCSEACREAHRQKTS